MVRCLKIVKNRDFHFSHRSEYNLYSYLRSVFIVYNRHCNCLVAVSVKHVKLLKLKFH